MAHLRAGAGGMTTIPGSRSPPRHEPPEHCYNRRGMSTPFPPDILDRMVRAVEKVRARLARAAAALEAGGVPYAVVGGNAVAAWVSKVDEAAVRNTQDVDILIQRSDLRAAVAALEGAGFVYRHVAGIDMFLDGSGAKARD